MSIAKITAEQSSAPPTEREEFVHAQYERLWTGVLEKAQKVLASGERDLSRVHLFMRRNFGPQFESEYLEKKYKEHERKKVQTGFIYDKQLIKVIDADSEVSTLMLDAVKMREVISSAGPAIERFVELGAGWSKNLFNLFKFGAPSNVEYHALELTKTGREIAELIAREVAPTMNLSTHFFDYYRPDFSMLSSPKSTCVLTHHSIEQIPQIAEELLERIISISGFSLCVHLEPVGFQIPTNNWLIDRDACETMRHIDEGNRRFAEKRNQNMNLYPLLRQLEQQGRIRIHTVRKYFTSHLLHNATTLIVWGPAQDACQVPIEENKRRDDLLPSTIEEKMGETVPVG